MRALRSPSFAIIILALAIYGCGGSSSPTTAGSSTRSGAGPAINNDVAQIVQRCIGYTPGQPWPKPAGPKPDTIQFCSQLPDWSDYEAAHQKFMDGDHAAATPLLNKSAQHGNPMAALRLAIMYDHGDGVDTDKKAAFHFYLEAAQDGEPASQNEVGSFYEIGGGGVPEDWITAARWYQLSANAGWHLGELTMGRAYEYGIGVPLDLQTALDWYTRAAEQGDGQAKFFADYIRNNHGIDGSFLSDEEEQIYNNELPGLHTLGHLVPPATGRVFRNKAERFAYIHQGIARILWAEFDACMHPALGSNAPQRVCVQPSVPRP